jgi:hypothetical protein
MYWVNIYDTFICVHTNSSQAHRSADHSFGDLIMIGLELYDFDALSVSFPDHDIDVREDCHE